MFESLGNGLMTDQRRASGYLRIVLTTVSCAVVGGFVVWLGQAGSFNLRPVGMSYADLAATLLSAVSVIVALFGGILALAALWGFNQLKRDAIAAAENAGSIEIREQIENGAIRDYIRSEIERLTIEEVNSGEWISGSSSALTP